MVNFNLIEKFSKKKFGYYKQSSNNLDLLKANDSDNDCQVPQWAIDIGHGELWKEHHNCK